MGDYSKNPKRPFVVRVPNRIRKHIAMHETDRAFHRRMEFVAQMNAFSRLKKIAALPAVAIAKKTGSLWSRFSQGVKKFWK